ncbi:hypothetical protein C8Q75DRAFT_733619 [Abortiporus biennis]|nr:hypothetical protein C8Q75DRAFT_733619 [Abortiporus biennis]
MTGDFWLLISARIAEWSFNCSCYPVDNPKCDNLQDIIAFMKVADKYQLNGASAWLQSELTPYINSHPVRIYALACRYGWETYSRLAAKACLSLTLDQLTDFDNPELKEIDARSFSRLHRYYAKCRSNLDSVISVGSIMSKIGRGSMKILSHRCRNITASANFSLLKMMNLRRTGDKQPSIDYSGEWLADFIDNIHTELLQRPCKDSVFNELHIGNARFAASSCESCRVFACHNFQMFINDLAALVEQTISEINEIHANKNDLPQAHGESLAYIKRSVCDIELGSKTGAILCGQSYEFTPSNTKRERSNSIRMNSDDTSCNARDSLDSPEQQWLRDFEFVHDERTPYVPRFTIPDLSTRSPRLPIEVCESVIQSLATPFKEEQALWNSALVCHDWLPLSRQYLYQQIIFYLVSDEARVWSFFKTLKMHPHLRDFVLELVYTQMHYPNYRSEPSDPNIKDIKKLIITAKLYHQLFMHGPTLLPQLRLLSLDDVPVLNHSILSIRHPFPKVTTFIVWFTKFTSLLTLRRITQNFFPNLELLQLMEISPLLSGG